MELTAEYLRLAQVGHANYISVAQAQLPEALQRLRRPGESARLVSSQRALPSRVRAPERAVAQAWQVPDDAAKPQGT